MFSYHQVQEHPKLFLAMTGLTQAEFDPLLQHFQCAWDQYVQQNYVDRDDRQRQYGGGRSELTLVNIEDKLLFILYYVKVYPLQEILAFEFGMVQSTANEWIHLLSEVLKKALDHGGYVLERDPKLLATVDVLNRMGLKVLLHCIGRIPDDARRNPRVRFHGFLDKRSSLEQLVNIMASCDMGCLLSDVDASSIAVLEFLRVGVPVMAPLVAETASPGGRFVAA